MPYKDPEKKKEYQRRYYREHREGILIRTRKYHKDNLEKCRKQGRKYYLEHKEERKKYNKKWAKNNTEKRREYVKRWENKNPLHGLNNRLMINGRMVTVRKREFMGVCEMCGKQVEPKAINWHHWDDKNPEYGLWLCFFCHGAAEASEQNDVSVPFYDRLKQLIIREFESNKQNINKGLESLYNIELVR